MRWLRWLIRTSPCPFLKRICGRHGYWPRAAAPRYRSFSPACSGKPWSGRRDTTPLKSAAWPCSARAWISARAAVLPGPGTTCMSGNRQFVDTNVLVYAYDVTAGDKHSLARVLMEELWTAREGCLSVQVLQEFFVTTTRKIPKP